MRLSYLPLLLLLFSHPGSGMAADEEETGEGKTRAAYFSLSPSLITNVQDGADYARCEIELMTLDEKNLEDIQLHAPAIRHELLLLLGDQKGSALKTPSGKERFRKQALKAAARVMKEQTGNPSVDDLFFTSYFVE